MLKVHFTRAKIFFSNATGSERRYQAAPPGVHSNVPDWVKDTLGWEMGVKDGSIVDLTPPKPAPAAVVEPIKQGSDQTGDDQTGDDEDDGKPAKPAKPAKAGRSAHGLQK